MANPLSDYLKLLLAPVKLLSGADRVAATMGAIAAALFDGKMWRSLGWLLVGVALFVIGVVLLVMHASKGITKGISLP